MEPRSRAAPMHGMADVIARSGSLARCGSLARSMKRPALKGIVSMKADNMATKSESMMVSDRNSGRSGMQSDAPNRLSRYPRHHQCHAALYIILHACCIVRSPSPAAPHSPIPHHMLQDNMTFNDSYESKWIIDPEYTWYVHRAAVCAWVCLCERKDRGGRSWLSGVAGRAPPTQPQPSYAPPPTFVISPSARGLLGCISAMCFQSAACRHPLAGLSCFSCVWGQGSS